MRPIDKGPSPQVNGAPKVVKDYREWREDLRLRIGRYCCYCNIPLPSGAHIEHVHPKNPPEGILPGSFLAWDNMLFACGNCNSAKGNTPVTKDIFYLPEDHNTHLAFEYHTIDHPFKPDHQACLAVPSAFQWVDHAKAIRTIELLNLDELKDDKGMEPDLRWHYRQVARVSASAWRKDWNEWGFKKAERFHSLLIQNVAHCGFFSIWFKVFQDVPSIRLALIQAFPGTATDCFDHNANPIPRNGTEI